MHLVNDDPAIEVVIDGELKGVFANQQFIPLDEIINKRVYVGNIFKEKSGEEYFKYTRHGIRFRLVEHLSRMIDLGIPIEEVVGEKGGVVNLEVWSYIVI